MTLDLTSIASRLWAVRPVRRRRFIANVLVHSLERMAQSLAAMQRPAPAVETPALFNEAPEGSEAVDDDDEYPSEEALAAIEAQQAGDAAEGFDDELDAFTAANAALEVKLTYEGCVTIAAAILEFHAQLVAQRVSTDALIHLVENLEDPEIGEEQVNFDRLADDQVRE